MIWSGVLAKFKCVCPTHTLYNPSIPPSLELLWCLVSLSTSPWISLARGWNVYQITVEGRCFESTPRLEVLRYCSGHRSGLISKMDNQYSTHTYTCIFFTCVLVLPSVPFACIFIVGGFCIRACTYMYNYYIIAIDYHYIPCALISHLILTFVPVINIWNFQFYELHVYCNNVHVQLCYDYPCIHVQSYHTGP